MCGLAKGVGNGVGFPCLKEFYLVHDHWARRRRDGFHLYKGLLLGTRPLGAEAKEFWIIGMRIGWKGGAVEFPLYRPGEGPAGKAAERGIAFIKGGQARGQ